MVEYSLEIKQPARKEWTRSTMLRSREMDRKTLVLADNPQPAGCKCKELAGYKDQWRLRVGDWRVLYIIHGAAKLVTIARIAHRREVHE